MMSGASSQRLHGRTSQVISHLLKLGIFGLVPFLVLAVGCKQGSPEARDALATALAAVRPGEGRLVGAPWLESASRREGSDEVVRKAVLASARALEKSVTAQTLRDDAIARFLAGQVDSAVDGLSKAAELEPSNAVVWSDLAAVHLQRSTEAADPYELLLALAAANRAVRLDPALQPARFNRALSLQRLSLRRKAAEEWRIVSKQEENHPWGLEAQRHATALTEAAAPRDWAQELSMVTEAAGKGDSKSVQSIVAHSPQKFREYLERKLLSAWSTAENEHRKSDGSRELAIARAIAEALVKVGGDRMAADTIVQIDRLGMTEPMQLRRLVKGFVAYFEGFDRLSNNDFSSALSRFKTAEVEFTSAGAPFAGWALFHTALCQFQLSNDQQARELALALIREPRYAEYKALQGRSLQLLGLIDGVRARLTESLTSFEAAEAAFREVREMGYVAKMNDLIASTLSILGQRQEAWRRLHAALVEPVAFERPDTWFAVCEAASWLAQEEGEIEIALWFQDEVVRSSEAMGPVWALGAHRQRAVLLATLGRMSEAAEDLRQARSYLQQITDPPSRRIVEGDILLVESELAGPAAPEQAIARLDEAIQIFRETSYHYRLVDALSRRALANKALGRYDDAECDLAAAIAELEQQRETVDSAEYRVSYLDRVKDIFDTMIELQIEQRQQPAEALCVSEQAKARVLWDWMMARPTKEPTLPHLRPAVAESFDLGAIQRGIPDGTAVVEYAVLPRKIVIWILHGRGDLRWESKEIGSAAVEDLAQKLRRAVLEDRTAEIQSLAEEAYNLLIRPVERHLAPGERLVLVPDGPLHALPFSVLRNPETGRHLFQDRVLAVAPSIRVYVESRRRDRALARGAGNVLVVAAPEFDRGIDPALLPLKAGETEASIVGIFPGRVLRGREATRKAFLQAAPEFELIHFGGHSVVNMDHPLLSQMLFARDVADPSRGVLYSGDVLRQSFPRTRLVVLASCGSAFGKISRTEGVENLARPFLAAGVPTVVASLWSVEDQVTAELFVRFYRNLKQGLDVAGALQATQIESFDHGQSPRVWAAFETIGGEALRSDRRQAKLN